MKWTKTSNRIPIKSWCENVESGALNQAINLTVLPFVVRHVALMPDCHEGFGMPIGGVIACKDTIIPNAVGVDIGCGMCAIQSDYPVEEINPDITATILRSVKKRIPVGFDHHKSGQSWEGFSRAPKIPVVQQELQPASYQLGTLGGGNHFIELQSGSNGSLWLMIHSGSRNFGYKIAKAYHKKALEYCEKRRISIPSKDLAYLPFGHKVAEEYMEAMNFALDFAYENRQRMKKWCKEILSDVLKCTFTKEINIHHNFAALEHHFGADVIVHRKGATSAKKNEPGIIPGSMGTPSYIVEGLGNPESFMSCSHGAGRIMGRNEANRRLSIDQVKKAMKGIVFDIPKPGKKGKIDLSEAPQAYKNIDEIIESEKDLVKVNTRLLPLGVVKG